MERDPITRQKGAEHDVAAVTSLLGGLINVRGWKCIRI
jgi:hypothetical protein